MVYDDAVTREQVWGREIAARCHIFISSLLCLHKYLRFPTHSCIIL